MRIKLFVKVQFLKRKRKGTSFEVPSFDKELICKLFVSMDRFYPDHFTFVAVEEIEYHFSK